MRRAPYGVYSLARRGCEPPLAERRVNIRGRGAVDTYNRRVDMLATAEGSRCHEILTALRERERGLAELSELTGMDWRNVSKHLSKLRREGLPFSAPTCVPGD